MGVCLSRKMAAVDRRREPAYFLPEPASMPFHEPCSQMQLCRS